ncbi:MAG: sodium:calcium antiporter [Flexistipes sinusarabici]|uniref:Sodium:calcium antiporter n=1 Tax=Flexistipes sinusarabici TaxID=2352 RepID=A0A5D0MLQ5_FLESI|nr:sodium:calcium antiporter [Flexistipes sinusarabici]TYB32533.1 MAG: sodium:calcium antiporter [Flexistipes sinusarabici]
MIYFLLFFISAVLVIISGIKLSEYGDVIALKTKLGHSFVGITMLALFTSLPELISSIGAVTIVDAPDLAFGNVYGSNVFNIFVIFILDLVFRRGSFFKDVSMSNTISGVYGLLIMVVTFTGFVIGFPVIGWVSLLSILTVFVFFISLYNAYKSSAIELLPEEGSVYEIPLNKALYMFFLNATIIVFAGLLLSKSADQVAIITGLGQSVVGALLLALVTSLPELASCYGAVKVGATNMAIGNLFGSNVFNMFIIPVVDIFYFKGSVFEFVEPGHLFTGLIACIMALIALLGIKQDKFSKFRVGHLSVYSVYILAVYIVYLFVTLN